MIATFELMLGASILLSMPGQRTYQRHGSASMPGFVMLSFVNVIKCTELWFTHGSLSGMSHAPLSCLPRELAQCINPRVGQVNQCCTAAIDGACMSVCCPVDSSAPLVGRSDRVT